MRTLRSFAIAVIVVLGLGLGLSLGSALGVSTPPRAHAASTGAGFAGITPYGGYLGNYVAPDGTRVYCIDAGLDWPSGPTSAGTVVDALATERGEPLAPAVLQRLNSVLLRYGQTTDPVLAAAVSAFVYAYTSGYAHTHGAGFEAGAHYIAGHAEVLAAYTALFTEAETLTAPPAPAATVSITMSDPLTGTVVVSTVPEGAEATLQLTGAVDAATAQSTIAVVDGVALPITGVPDAAIGTYWIDAAVSLQAISGDAAAVTLYTTGDQQRTIRDAGQAVVEVAASARAEVELPAPELAATGAPRHPSLAVGTGLALLAVGAVVTLWWRRREFLARRRVD